MNLRKRILLSLLVMLFLSCPAEASDTEGAKEAICQGFEIAAERIDLADYDLELEDVQTIFFDLRNQNRLPWYAYSFRYTYNTKTGKVIALFPVNLDETIYDRSAYEQAVQQVLDQAVLPGMSQRQIALSVHDYLVSNFQYDESLTQYTGYDLLIKGSAVCEGYSRAYLDILNRAGIDGQYISSDAMNHGWNLICLDGKWYHVDVTWDDPSPDVRGRVMHTYFLLDDGTISDGEHNHFLWNTDERAEDDSFAQEAFWQEVTSAICYESAEVCYIRWDEGTEHRIYRREESTGNLTKLVCWDDGYIDIGSGKYHYATYGLSLWNGKLYYSDMTHVYAMNTDGTGQTVLFLHQPEESGTFLRGASADGGVILLTFSDHEGNLTQEEVPLPSSEQPSHQLWGHWDKKKVVFT